MVTSTMEVLNDAVESVDAKDYCAAFFIDLSKAFDTVDHQILCHKITDNSLSGWADL